MSPISRISLPDARCLKPEPISKFLGEDRTAIQTEIGWLRKVKGRLNLVNGHDDDSVKAQIRQRVLEDGLDFRP